MKLELVLGADLKLALNDIRVTLLRILKAMNESNAPTVEMPKEDPITEQKPPRTRSKRISSGAPYTKKEEALIFSLANKGWTPKQIATYVSKEGPFRNEEAIRSKVWSLHHPNKKH